MKMTPGWRFVTGSDGKPAIEIAATLETTYNMYTSPNNDPSDDDADVKNSGANLEIDIKYDDKNFERAYSRANSAGSFTAAGVSESAFTSKSTKSVAASSNGVATGGVAYFSNGSLWTQKS